MKRIHPLTKPRVIRRAGPVLFAVTVSVLFFFTCATSYAGTWTTDTTASGPLCNSLFDYHIAQTYDSVVDQIGEVRTPYGDFDQVLRVNTHVKRHVGVGVMPTEARTHTFVAECFTTVANVVSEEGVSDPDFSDAAEVRRLSLLP